LRLATTFTVIHYIIIASYNRLSWQSDEV